MVEDTRWTDEATEMVAGLPLFLKDKTKGTAEKMCYQRGLDKITIDLVKEAQIYVQGQLGQATTKLDPDFVLEGKKKLLDENSGFDRKGRTARDFFGWMIPRIVATGSDYFDTNRVLSQIIDRETWVGKWCELGAEYEVMGDDALGRGDKETAVHAYLLAAQAYRWSHVIITKATEKKTKLVSNTSRMSAKAVDYMQGGSRLDIPFNGKTMPAYLFVPENVARPDLVFIISGFDSCKEEQIKNASYFVERGLAACVYDAPGQGETRLNDILFHPETNPKSCGNAIDYITSLPDFAFRNIGFWGLCIGGSTALMAAAFDDRIKAIAVSSGWHSADSDLSLAPGFVFDNVVYAAGYNKRKDMDEMIKTGYSVDPFLGQIKSPVFLVDGTDNNVVPPQHIDLIYNGLVCPKDKKIFEGGDHTCSNMHTKVKPIIADWLRTTLAAK